MGDNAGNTIKKSTVEELIGGPLLKVLVFLQDVRKETE